MPNYRRFYVFLESTKRISIILKFLAHFFITTRLSASTISIRDNLTCLQRKTAENLLCMTFIRKPKVDLYVLQCCNVFNPYVKKVPKIKHA